MKFYTNSNQIFQLSVYFHFSTLNSFFSNFLLIKSNLYLYTKQKKYIIIPDMIYFIVVNRKMCLFWKNNIIIAALE